MNFARRFPIRAFSSAGAGAAGLGLMLTLGSSGGATPSDPARTLAAPQQAVRPPARRMPRSLRPRTPSCGASASGPNAFDSTWDFETNKSNSTVFGASNLAAAGYTGVFEGNGNTICDYNSVILGGNADTIDSGSGNTPSGASYSIIGAGTSNTVSNYEAFIGAGTSNAVSGFDSFIGAGLGNALSGTVSFIGAGHVNTVSGHLSFVGAGFGNNVSGPGSFIGAGGAVSATNPNNQISGSDSFIGAGDDNNLSANEAFIGAGLSNRIAGFATYSVIAGGTFNAAGSQIAAIGGGEYNTATGGAGVVGGGAYNTTSGGAGVVGGGEHDVAGGSYATVPGGLENTANGSGSFAAGTYAKALNKGAFVWSDSSTSAALQSTADNQFVARASGGVIFFSNSAATLGVKLAPGSGAWASASDRALKSDVVPLNDGAVLAKVAELPISEWSYTAEHGVRHVGPMAQDFYAAFGVGEDDRHITSIDEDGVALAAIKALHRENADLRAGLRSQHAELVALQDEIRGLEAKFASTRTR